MLNLWSTKTPNFFSSCGFSTSQFSISLFLYNYCFKHKFRTLQLMLLFNINVNTNSWHLLEIYHVDLVGFSPVFTLWDCCESCFFPFLFFFPQETSVCLSVERDVCISSTCPSGCPLYPAMFWFWQVHSDNSCVGSRSRGRDSSHLDLCTSVYVLLHGPSGLG